MTMRLVHIAAAAAWLVSGAASAATWSSGTLLTGEGAPVSPTFATWTTTVVGDDVEFSLTAPGLDDFAPGGTVFIGALAVAGSVGGLITASLLLLVGKSTRDRVVPWLVSYAVGTLLGAALLGLTPQALERLAPTPALGALLAGIMTFFVLEKLVLWRHSHDDHGGGFGHLDLVNVQRDRGHAEWRPRPCGRDAHRRADDHHRL